MAAGTLAAQWLVRAGGPSWAYGVRFATRAADGAWTPPRIPHGEDHAAEHGFVSMLSPQPGAFELVWLDGRFGYEELRMSALVPRGNRLYFVAFADRGNVRRVISLRYAERREVKHYVENI